MVPTSASVCAKVRYRDRIAALMALASTARGSSSRAEVRAYRCPDCGGWHLTSKKAYAAPSLAHERRARAYRPPSVEPLAPEQD